jgi:hypothetical protein
MSKLSLKTRTLIAFLCASALFYASFTVTFFSFFLNIILFIFAMFVLLQGCAGIDKMNGIDLYDNTKHKNNTTNDDEVK